ncbi:imidazoleglycerol-phosphate dehydratase, partial [Mycobacterium tuberculosis]|nr:imidazoleglycerol-phosphate dehydratase [Mycobacterium tuberculosis]
RASTFSRCSVPPRCRTVRGVELSMIAGFTLHVATLYGSNNHHIAEGCFKAFARALRAAVAVDPRRAGVVPSTKGVLGG